MKIYLKMEEDTITNRYNIIRKLGQGSYGIVNLAVSKKTGSQVAIKIIPLTEQNQSNVIQEISSLKLASIPNCNPYVVCYYDSFIDPSTFSVVLEMEHIDGPNIMEYTQPARTTGNTKLLIDTSKKLLIAMLNGLKYIHTKGIIHNDVKPGNIVVGKNKVPVLVDLGISCVVQAAVTEICTKPYNSIIGNCCQEMSGTSLYIPPEIIYEIRYPESDLWSLGSTVYEIMTGSNIWSLNTSQFTPINIMAQVIMKFNSKTLPNKLNTGDYQLDTVVNSFLTYDPTARMSIDEALIVLKI